jgi:hypothetical protein
MATALGVSVRFRYIILELEIREVRNNIDRKGSCQQHAMHTCHVCMYVCMLYVVSRSKLRVICNIIYNSYSLQLQ